MSFLDLFLPASGPEREAALADLEELRALASRCDCDRADPRDPHEPWCPALEDE